ncbi:MAG: adenylyl-sulfate kinase, partial [Myxococcota bacterium]
KSAADFTGIDDPYEPPEKPEVHIRTDSESVEESVDTIITTLRSLEYVD